MIGYSGKKHLNPWLASLHTTSFNCYEQKIVTLYYFVYITYFEENAIFKSFKYNGK
jgi:hypothetical protein